MSLPSQDEPIFLTPKPPLEQHCHLEQQSYLEQHSHPRQHCHLEQHCHPLNIRFNMGAETAFPSIPTAVPLKAAIKHIVWAVQYVLIFVGLYTVASFSTGIHVESKVAISSSLVSSVSFSRNTTELTRRWQTLGSILVTIQYLYGRWRQTQTSTDGDLSNSAKPPEQAAIPQSHAPVKPTERAAVASQSHATAAPTSRSAPTSLSDSNGQLPPSTKVASGGLSILVKPSEQAVNRLHGQPSSSTACRYPYYVAPDPLLFSLLGPPPPDLPPTRRGSGRGPPCDPPPSLSTSFLIPVRVESLQKPGNQFYYVGIPPLHFIHDRTTGRDFTLTAFFRLPLNRALREYHLNIAVAHIQAEFPLGMINEDWKPVLYERPQLIHYDGRQYFWDNISIKITPSGAVQYDLIVFYYRLGFPSRARDTICLGHDRSGHWKDEETGKPIKVGELDTQNTSMVKQILTPGGCRKVKVGPRLGVVFARSTDLEPEDYPAVKSATVFFGGEWQVEQRLKFLRS